MFTGYSANSGSFTTQSMAGFFANSKDIFRDMRSRKTLVSRARYLNTISTISRAIHDCLVRAVVGSGIRYEQPNSEILSYDISDIKKAWERISMTHALDAHRRNTLTQLETLVFSTMLVSGEAWCFRFGNGWVIKEPDFVSTPDDLLNGDEAKAANGNTIIDGIEVNNFGIPVACYFCDDPYGSHRKWERIAYKDDQGELQVLHVFMQERPEQLRGLPLTAPVLTQIWSVLAYCDSETQMSILQANMSLVITTNTNQTLNPFATMSARDLDAPLIPEKGSNDFNWFPPMGNSAIDGIINKVNYSIPGQTRHLAEGEDIKFVAPTAPHTGFVNFADFMIRQIGASIGIPEQVLTGKFDANFSAVKGACSSFNHTVRRYRTAFIELFLKPMFGVFLKQFIQDDLICDLIMVESQWLPNDSPLTLDPAKEMDFYIKAVDAGFITADEAAEALFGHPATGERLNVPLSSSEGEAQ